MRTRGKRPTSAQKKAIGKLGLNPLDYLVLRETPTEIIVKNKYTDRVLVRLKRTDNER